MTGYPEWMLRRHTLKRCWAKSPGAEDFRAQHEGDSAEGALRSVLSRLCMALGLVPFDEASLVEIREWARSAPMRDIEQQVPGLRAFIACELADVWQEASGVANAEEAMRERERAEYERLKAKFG